MAKVNRRKIAAPRKTAGKFFVAQSTDGDFYGDLLVFKKKPQGEVYVETDTIYDVRTNKYKEVKLPPTVSYDGEDQTICASGFKEVVGRQIKPGEAWRVDFKLTRIDKAGVRAKRAKQAKKK